MIYTYIHTYHIISIYIQYSPSKPASSWAEIFAPSLFDGT